ncbi:hypothetical protein WDW86_12425 [Bdellovibrionota bacterium FG-2]
MAHKRVLMPSEFATGEKLTAEMVNIGVRFAATPTSHGAKAANIEDTLMAASIEGIILEDYRVLSLLVDWLGIHIERVNADRLIRMVQLFDDKRVRAFWAAVAQWQSRDWRFKRLQLLHQKPRIDLAAGTDYQLQKYGEDKRFENTVLRVPHKLLRQRVDDILSPRDLAQKHLAYHYRVMIGPSYRADMWALLERSPGLTPTELARQSYGSFPTAWEVRRDWMILHNPRTEMAKVS